MSLRKPGSRATPLSLLLMALVAGAAGLGCGGQAHTGPSEARPVITLGTVVRCLRQAVHDGRVTTAPGDLDQIARRATAGAAAVRFGVSSGAPKGTNIATIVLERSTVAARATEGRYRAVYRALGGHATGLLSRTANAVVAFGAAPSRSQRSIVARCLQLRR